MDRIESLDKEIAGYVVMAWDDTRAVSGSVKPGGPISWDLLLLHVYTHTTRFLDRATTRKDNENEEG